MRWFSLLIVFVIAGGAFALLGTPGCSPPSDPQVDRTKNGDQSGARNRVAANEVATSRAAANEAATNSELANSDSASGNATIDSGTTGGTANRRKPVLIGPEPAITGKGEPPPADVTIAGVLLHATGEPAVGIEIELVCPDGSRPKALTDEKGAFLFDGQLRGQYLVGVFEDDYEPINKSVVANLIPKHELELHLKPVVSWRGVVQDEYGVVMKDVLVVLNGGRPSVTNDNGEALTRGAVASTYTLLVVHSDLGERTFTAEKVDDLPKKITLKKSP